VAVKGDVTGRRCRKVGEAGSQQLLLDTQAIKALLLDFPSAGARCLRVARLLHGVVHAEALCCASLEFFAGTSWALDRERSEALDSSAATSTHPFEVVVGGC